MKHPPQNVLMVLNGVTQDDKGGRLLLRQFWIRHEPLRGQTEVVTAKARRRGGKVIFGAAMAAAL